MSLVGAAGARTWVCLTNSAVVRGSLLCVRSPTLNLGSLSAIRSEEATDARESSVMSLAVIAR